MSIELLRLDEAVEGLLSEVVGKQGHAQLTPGGCRARRADDSLACRGQLVLCALVQSLPLPVGNWGVRYQCHHP
ncbi:MAG: hypothetical protein C4297_00110 [Gemmataceae bacterium]